MNHENKFEKTGYLVIRKIISDEEIARLYDYTVKRMSHGNFDDGQVPGSASFYQDREVMALQKKLCPRLEEAIQVKLIPVFCYHRIYRTGAILRMHKDSTRAEISTTINLGQQGEPWDIWLVDYDENTHKITLTPGDALIYFGHKLHHWRGKLTHADFVSQIMFHFVDGNGKHTRAAKTEVFRKIRKFFRQIRGIAY